VELLQGEPYEMRVSVASITGPLLDVDVAFLNAQGERCFLVTWRLMLVVDAPKKLMFDFERGGVFGSEAPEPTAPKKVLKIAPPRAVTYRTWFGLVLLLLYIANYILFHLAGVLGTLYAFWVSARANFSPEEVYFVLAIICLAVGVEFGLWSFSVPFALPFRRKQVQRDPNPRPAAPRLKQFLYTTTPLHTAPHRSGSTPLQQKPKARSPPVDTSQAPGASLLKCILAPSGNFAQQS